MDCEQISHWVAHTASADSISGLNASGITVKVTIDSKEIANSIEQVGKEYLTPWLDPRKNDFSQDNYFWLIASQNGQAITVGGGRLDIVSSNYADFIQKMFERGYGRGAVKSVNSEVSRYLKGRVCYLGDLYSKSKNGLGRNNRQNFVVIANYIASVHFKADVTYSFMHSRDVRRGSADVNGFDQRIYQPFVWGLMPEGRGASEVAVFRRSQRDTDYFNEIKRELAKREVR